MDLIFPSGLRISLPEEAKEDCELIKTVLELEEVNEIPIGLPFELTDTYLKKYELSYDELSELTEEELSKWLQLKSFLGYYESGEKYENEMKKLRKVINEYKESGVWAEDNDDNVCIWTAKKGYLKILKYAHENGCPWNEKTIQYNYIIFDHSCTDIEMERKLSECIIYAIENGCSYTQDDINLLPSYYDKNLIQTVVDKLDNKTLSENINITNNAPELKNKSLDGKLSLLYIIIMIVIMIFIYNFVLF